MTGVGGYIQNLSGTNQGFFMIFVVSSIIASLLMFLCVPLLRRLTRTVNA